MKLWNLKRLPSFQFPIFHFLGTWHNTKNFWKKYGRLNRNSSKSTVHQLYNSIKQLADVTYKPWSTEDSNIQDGPKKASKFHYLTTSSNIFCTSKFFHQIGQFATTWLLKILPQLKCLATLPRVSKTEINIISYEIGQWSIWGVVGSLMITLFQI